jgi:hypothetical protein
VNKNINDFWPLMFATQPVYNARRAAHALRLDKQDFRFCASCSVSSYMTGQPVKNYISQKKCQICSMFDFWPCSKKTGQFP